MPKGRRPLTPAGMISPHPLFFLILRRVLRLRPQHSAHFYNKRRGTTLSQENREKNRPPPASRSARVRRRAPFHGGRLACRAVAPYHVVKMRDTRSLRVFNENYPLSRSFSLRVVGVLYPHTPLRGYYTLALLSPPNVHLGYACDEAATSFLVLTALRHSGRSFTAHVAESAEVSMGLCPIPYARVLYPRAPMLFVYSSFKHPFCQGTAPKNLLVGVLYPHTSQAITLFLFHASVLSRNCAENFAGNAR